MKISVLILVLIFFNTTAILSETVYLFIKGIDLWVLIGLELLLIVVYYVNKIIKDVSNALVDADFNNLNLQSSEIKKLT